MDFDPIKHRWHLCADKLPEFYGDTEPGMYWLVWDGIDVHTAEYNYCYGWKDTHAETDSITHWMPLPKPPES